MVDHMNFLNRIQVCSSTYLAEGQTLPCCHRYQLSAASELQVQVSSHHIAAPMSSLPSDLQLQLEGQGW